MVKQKFITYDAKQHILYCKDHWDIKHLTIISQELSALKLDDAKEVVIDGSELEKMDSAGAWLFCEKVELPKRTYSFQHFPEKYQQLIQLVKSKIEEKDKGLKPVPKENFLIIVGKGAEGMFKEFLRYLSFVGQLTLEGLRTIYSFFKFRLGPLSRTLFDTGYTALPIIALLSFMIGIVITYQMGLQLKNYGANVFIVDLLGLSILREFAPLLTAIMVAGRSGSAYTAQLGIMKINQEIDALDTMGVTPAELLILPRIIGLMITLPLLTMWANIFGVLGGMVMSSNMLNLTWYDFLQRFQHVIGLKALLIGLGKTPIFALLISSIACYQGMMVKGSAESIGRNTTRSVVLAIFFIIVADAVFSVIFSKLKL